MFGEDPRIVATLEKDTCKTYEEALLEIYRKLRPGEPPTVDSAETLLDSTCSLTPAAMTCPAWAVISSIRSWTCGRRLTGQTLAAARGRSLDRRGHRRGR